MGIFKSENTLLLAPGHYWNVPCSQGNLAVNYKGKTTGFRNSLIQPTAFSPFLLFMRCHCYSVAQAGIPGATLNSRTPILVAMVAALEVRVVRPIAKTGCPQKKLGGGGHDS